MFGWKRQKKKPSQVPLEVTDASTDEAVLPRRGFFAKAAIGGVALGATGGLAKVTISSVPSEDLQELYFKEAQAGDKVLSEREYVEMTGREKEEMVEDLIMHHKKHLGDL